MSQLRNQQTIISFLSLWQVEQRLQQPDLQPFDGSFRHTHFGHALADRRLRVFVPP